MRNIEKFLIEKRGAEEMSNELYEPIKFYIQASILVDLDLFLDTNKAYYITLFHQFLPYEEINLSRTIKTRLFLNYNRSKRMDFNNIFLDQIKIINNDLDLHSLNMKNVLFYFYSDHKNEVIPLKEMRQTNKFVIEDRNCNIFDNVNFKAKTNLKAKEFYQYYDVMKLMNY